VGVLVDGVGDERLARVNPRKLGSLVTHDFFYRKSADSSTNYRGQAGKSFYSGDLSDK